MSSTTGTPGDYAANVGKISELCKQMANNFDATGRKSMVYAQTNYALILKYIAFLGYDKDDLLFGLDIMPDAVMNKIIQL